MNLKLQFNCFAEILELSMPLVGGFQSWLRGQTCAFVSHHFVCVFGGKKDYKIKGLGARTNQR